MIIQCPECTTRFEVAGAQLKNIGTKVRCSKCRLIFYAYAVKQGQLARVSTVSEHIREKSRRMQAAPASSMDEQVVVQQDLVMPPSRPQPQKTDIQRKVAVAQVTTPRPSVQLGPPGMTEFTHNISLGSLEQPAAASVEKSAEVLNPFAEPTNSEMRVGELSLSMGSLDVDSSIGFHSAESLEHGHTKRMSLEGIGQTSINFQHSKEEELSSLDMPTTEFFAEHDSSLSSMSSMAPNPFLEQQILDPFSNISAANVEKNSGGVEFDPFSSMTARKSEQDVSQTSDFEGASENPFSFAVVEDQNEAFDFERHGVALDLSGKKIAVQEVSAKKKAVANQIIEVKGLSFDAVEKTSLAALGEQAELIKQTRKNSEKEIHQPHPLALKILQFLQKTENFTLMSLQLIFLFVCLTMSVVWARGGTFKQAISGQWKEILAVSSQKENLGTYTIQNISVRQRETEMLPNLVVVSADVTNTSEKAVSNPKIVLRFGQNEEEYWSYVMADVSPFQVEDAISKMELLSLSQRNNKKKFEVGVTVRVVIFAFDVQQGQKASFEFRDASLAQK